MALGKRDAERQDDIWIATGKLVQGPGHPFYAKLNAVLAAAGFDRFVEARCAKFYAAKVGRPGIALRVLPHALRRLLRGDRLRARHRVALRRLAGAARVPGLRPHSSSVRLFSLS